MKVEATFIFMAHTLRPHGLESTKLLCPGDSPCQSTGVGAVSSSRLPLWLSWWRICLQCRRPGFNPWVGKIPWRRERLPAPVVWHGEFKKSDTTEQLSLSLSSSRGSSRFRNQTHFSESWRLHCRQILHYWATEETPIHIHVSILFQIIFPFITTYSTEFLLVMYFIFKPIDTDNRFLKAREITENSFSSL